MDAALGANDTSAVGLSIFEIATARWLHVEEIISLLVPESTPLLLSTSPPTSPPPSGTLLLYDRSVTRKYKGDGHEWTKKRNSPKVREDHVKLRHRGAYRVSGSYVHSARTATLHRRAYRLLDVPGVPPGPTQNWVLLHYLDTMEAAQISALFADHLAAAASKTGLRQPNRRFSNGSGGGVSHTPSPVPTPSAGGLVFRPPAAQFGSSGAAACALGGAATTPTALAQTQAHAQLQAAMRQSHSEAQARQHAVSTAVTAQQALDTGPAWPEYAKHVAAATVKMGRTDSLLPERHQLADPAFALKAGLKPAPPLALKPPGLAVAAAGHGLQQQQEAAEEMIAGEAAAGLAAGAEAAAVGALVLSSKHHHQRDASLGEGTMDVLWNMVMEEGTGEFDTELEEAAASAIQQHMTPIIEAELLNTVEDALQDAATATLALEDHVNFVSDEDILQAVEQVMTKGSLEASAAGAIEDKVVSTLEDKLPAELEAKLLETMEKEMAPADANTEEQQHIIADRMKATSALPFSMAELPQTPLPEVIDFTPDETRMNSERPMSLVISTSASLPILPPDDLPYRWHLLAAFVDMSSSAIFTEPAAAVGRTAETDPTIMKVALTHLRKLTPFSCKCEAPEDISYAGSRSIILVGVRYVESPEPVWDAIRLAVKVCIQAEWQVASDMNEAQSSVGAALVRPTFYAPAGGGNIQLLSQLSSDLFTFHRGDRVAAAAHPSTHVAFAQEQVADSGDNRPDDNWGAMSIKSMSTMDKSGEEHTQDTVGALPDLPAPPPTMAAVASAMTSLPFNPPNLAVDVAPSLSRKRTFREDDHTSLPSLAAANTAAADWIEKQDPNADHSKTLGETVDRHCKIRFVERLANAAAAADPGLKTHKHQPLHTDDANSEASFDSDTGIMLDASKLQQIDEGTLDSLLDSVLIKFVESLVDTCASDEEMKKEINTMGYAGFALLHYAALYDMKSLMPLLLNKGADVDLRTLKGGLTPLHLAAGAGNDQICDLLARSGATVNVQDSFGLIPADHADRNGFTEIGKWLQDKKLPAQDPSKGSSVAGGEAGSERHLARRDITNAAIESWASNDPADEFLQSAFKGLPLKDKLGLNLFVQKYRRKARSRREAGDGAGSSSQSKSDEGCGDDGMGDSSDDEEGRRQVAAGGNEGSQADSDSSIGPPDDCMGDLRFISEKDRDSLKVAMSMMSKEEIQELERSAPYSDVRNWMLRSNYESLREASIQLEKQAKRKNLTKLAGSESTVGQIQSGNDAKDGGQLGNPKLSQALAMLVLRKNLLTAKGKKMSQKSDEEEESDKI